jgi:hypothetical protein
MNSQNNPPPKKRIIRIRSKKKKVDDESIPKLPDKSTLRQEYIDQLTDKERLVFEIAKEHLGSSFNIERSIGFQEFLRKKKLNGM